jgi:hypothetical protein
VAVGTIAGKAMAEDGHSARALKNDRRQFFGRDPIRPGRAAC